jgi:uncharacterized protein YlxP (DUF503 family)
MHVGVLVIEILLFSSDSLKEKRYVLRSIKDRLKKKFNVAVSEIDYQDKWQRSKIGIATISNQPTHVEQSLQQIFQYLDHADDYEIVSYDYRYY